MNKAEKLEVLKAMLMDVHEKNKAWHKKKAAGKEPAPKKPKKTLADLYKEWGIDDNG